MRDPEYHGQIDARQRCDRRDGIVQYSAMASMIPAGSVSCVIWPHPVNA